MLHFIELIIALTIILLTVPQTSTENVVLRNLLGTGFFTTYSQAKGFLLKTTWSLIFLFLLLLVVMNLKIL